MSIIETPYHTAAQSMSAATQKDIDAYKDVCSICLEKLTEARHLLHMKCLAKELQYRCLCPVCKATLKDIIPATAHPNPSMDPTDVFFIDGLGVQHVRSFYNRMYHS